jgi:hypothetical protein
VDQRKTSYCQQDSDDVSQAGKRMRCSIPDLPEVLLTLKTGDASLDTTHCIARKSWMLLLFISKECIF